MKSLKVLQTLLLLINYVSNSECNEPNFYNLLVRTLFNLCTRALISIAAFSAVDMSGLMRLPNLEFCARSFVPFQINMLLQLETFNK